jgi:hypothetical protein
VIEFLVPIDFSAGGIARPLQNLESCSKSVVLGARGGAENSVKLLLK